jgi:hypothetical protein
LDLLLNQESRPIPTPVLPPSNDLRPSARPPRLLRLARVPRGASASLAILAGSISIAGGAHATPGHAGVGTDARRGLAVVLGPARAFTSAGERRAETAARIAVAPVISPEYQASRRLSRGVDRSSRRAGSSVAAADHRITGPAVAAGVRAAARPLLDAPVGQGTRLGVGRPTTELPRQGRQAGAATRVRPAKDGLARCYRQYYVPGNSQYQFAEPIIMAELTKCTQTSYPNSREDTPMAPSATRSMTLRIHSQTERTVAASTVRSVSTSASPKVGVARVISPQLGAVPTASRPGSTPTSRSTAVRSRKARAEVVVAGQLGDTRRVLQLGLVFAAVYLVFLISWFWGTRGRRRRAASLRRREAS